MSAVSLPVTRPTGRALVIGQPACRSAPVAALQRIGFACTEVDEPYDGMVNLCRRPLFYSAMILSLNSLYREELQIIGSIKRRFSHIEVWLSDTDGRQAALAEAMRLGADGLVDAQGLHRIGAMPGGSTGAPMAAAGQEILPPFPPVSHAPASSSVAREIPAAQESPLLVESVQSAASQDRSSDPLLTAEELRALLQENPTSEGA